MSIVGGWVYIPLVLPTVGRSHYSLDLFRLRGDRFLFARRREVAPEAGTASNAVSAGRGSDSLVYLEQGQARAMREHARQDLRCPEPDCTAPEITTVSRSTGGARDGFRHLRRPESGAHAAEGVMHRQAKALVARWARDHPAVAAVQLEAPVGGGERVADVLLTSKTGNRLAVEVQFAGLSLDSYLERTGSYAALGIPVVWLWGNCGVHSPRVGTISAVHRAGVRDARPLLWINPADETIAWAYATRRIGPLRGHDHEPPARALDPEDGGFDVAFGGLEDMELRATGIFPPGWGQLRARARDHAHQLAIDEATEREAARLRAETAQRLSTWKPRPPRPWTPPPQPQRRASKEHCRRCGLPLDPVLWAAGQHLGDCTRLD